jgi:hypothetical protein
MPTRVLESEPPVTTPEPGAEASAVSGPA